MSNLEWTECQIICVLRPSIPAYGAFCLTHCRIHSDSEKKWPPPWTYLNRKDLLFQTLLTDREFQELEPDKYLEAARRMLDVNAELGY